MTDDWQIEMIPLTAASGIEYCIPQAEDIGPMAHVLGGTFSRGEPPAMALGLPPSAIEDLVLVFGPKAKSEGLCIIARSTATEELVGALLAQDFATPAPDGLDPLVPVLLPVLALLEQLETSYREVRSIVPGVYLHLFMIGVLEEWSGKGVAQNMIRACVNNGAARGYRVAFTEATGSISQHVFSRTGFERRFFSNYQEFELDGQRPFASIRGHEGCALMERDIAIDR